MKSERKNKKNIWLEVVFMAVLFLIPFLHVAAGVAVSDTTYNLGNFEAFPNFNQTWMISTILSNVVGWLASMLPGGHTMLAMSIYTTTLVGVLTVLIYLLARKFFNALPVFVAMAIAVLFCWCPRVILYHYLTYLLFDIAVFLLMTALVNDNKKLCVYAGIVLALNTFARFPNIVEVGLIVVVFAYAIIYRVHVIKEFLACFIGYVATFLAGVFVISVCFGFDSYPAMIKGLFGMTEEATSYTPTAMVFKMFEDYLLYIKWFVFILVAAAVAFLIYGFVKKGIARILLLAFEALLVLVVARMMHYYGIFSVDYTLYSSIFVWGEFVVYIAVITAVYALASKKVDKKFKVMAVAVITVILITPIGSNNGFYSMLNNMFIPSVFVVGMMGEMNVLGKMKEELFDGIVKKDAKRSKEEVIENKEVKKAKMFGKFEANLTPIVFAFLLVLAACVVQGLGFWAVFVFRDASFISGDYVLIEDDAILGGMRTGSSNAESLSSLKNYIDTNEKDASEVILFGNIPGIAYCTGLECAISHTWPDLDSYPYDEMRSDLDKVKGTPLVIVHVDYDGIDKGLDYEGPVGKKTDLITSFLHAGNYREVFRNSTYIVYSVK